jgi:hypothetical protein
MWKRRNPGKSRVYGCYATQLIKPRNDEEGKQNFGKL